MGGMGLHSSYPAARGLLSNLPLDFISSVGSADGEGSLHSGKQRPQNLENIASNSSYLEIYI
jgi:hypothetical protein